MGRISRRLIVLALPALAACTSMSGGQGAAASDAYAGKSVLDAAIEAAGGQAALSQVKELGWTGTATINADGKTSEVELQTIVRPFTFGRTTSWPRAGDKKAARTIQAEFGNAWTVNRVTWAPMPEAEAAHENQQYALYGVMLLTPLKDEGVKVEERASDRNGRTLHVEHPKAPPMDLTFDASARLVQAAYSVRDPKGGEAPIAQVAEFSGEIISNGVKWPRHVKITQNGAPYLDMELATFEARPQPAVVPLEHTLQTEGQPSPPSGADAG